MTQSARSGPEKGKGYWQAIANYNHAVAQHVATLPTDEIGLAEMAAIAEQRENHPEYGAFLAQLAHVHEVISETYGISMEEVSDDIDALCDAEDALLEIHEAGKDWHE